jgi:hypothetical protein
VAKSIGEMESRRTAQYALAAFLGSAAAQGNEEAADQLQQLLDSVAVPEEGEVSYLLDPNAKPDLEALRRHGLLPRIKTDQEVTDANTTTTATPVSDS